MHPTFKEKMKEWWRFKVNGTTMYRFSKKLREVKRILKQWNKIILKNVEERKNELKEQLDKMENKILRKGSDEEIDKKEKEVLA